MVADGADPRISCGHAVNLLSRSYRDRTPSQGLLVLCYFNLVGDESKAWLRENKVDAIKGTDSSVRFGHVCSTTVNYHLVINYEAAFKKQKNYWSAHFYITKVRAEFRNVLFLFR